MLEHSRPQFALELLWRATWQSAALALIVVTVMMVARKQIAPSWRVVLWALPLCRLALLVVPTSSVSLFNIVEPNALATIVSATSMPPLIQTSDLRLPSNEFTLPLTDRLLDTRQVPLLQNPLLQNPLLQNPLLQIPRQQVASTSPFDSVEPSTAIVDSLADIRTATIATTTFKILFWLWIAGCLCSLVRTFLNRLRLIRMLSHTTPLDRDDINEHISMRRKSLGIRRQIECLLIDDEVGPASTGLLRPKILIPQNLLCELDFCQLLSIVDHEIQHIRRFDSVYLLLNQVACCLHWFNPLAYWLAARVRAEIEHAVDAATVGLVDDQAKKNYGDLLIHLASRRSRSLGLAPMADRRSNLKQRIDELHAPVCNTKLRSASCLAAILLLMVTGLSEVASTQEQTTKSASASSQNEPTTEAKVNSIAKENREFELLIVDTEGRVVSEAQVEIRGEPKVSLDSIVEGQFIKQGFYGPFARPTKDGRIKLLLSSKSAYSFSIKADGYGPYWAEWDRSEPPATFKAVLDLGRTVGGVIVDEIGRPIADAVVRPSVNYKKRPGDTSQLGIGAKIKTDSEGRWSYANLPRENKSFTVEITHPQFKPQIANLSAETFELLPGQQASRTTAMEKGVSVTGKIVDAAGKPVKGALIRTKLLNDVRSTTSNDHGVYQLSGCQAGVARIVASAPGMAVDMKSVHIEKTMEPVDFTMQPGGHVRIRVVDEKGGPVPKARIFFQRWREGKYNYFEFDHINQYTDENGIWEWNEAPIDEFKADICRPDGMELGKQELIARAEEYVFACPPKLVVVGRVIDAETKQPIENFQVIPGVRSDPQHMNWVPHQMFSAKDGAFEYTEGHDYFAHLFKIQAGGYWPVESRDIESNEGRVELTFELDRGVNIDMRVMTPKGLPAQGAKVALGIPGAQINVKNGDIDDGSTYAQRTVVNAVGRLRLPGQSTPYQLIITHESGFAHFKSDQAERKDLVQLTPWASAEGVYRVAKQPVGGVELYLNSGDVHSYGKDVPSIFTSCETVTKQDGSFRFDRVFPGSGRVARSILKIVDEGAKEVTSSTSLAVEFISEKTTRVDFGLDGCPIVGTLIKPDSYDERVLWSFADINVQPQLGPGPAPVPDELKAQPGNAQDWYNTWVQTDAGKAWRTAELESEKARRVSPHYSATCNVQGQFRIDDMPSGTYTLSVRFYEKPPVGQLQNYVFSVPESNAKQGVTFNLGALQLEGKSRN